MIASTVLLALAAPKYNRCAMAASTTNGVPGIPGKMLPAVPKHITNNASDKPMICSAVTSKI